MIQKISESTKNSIRQKSVYNLPDRPSDYGMTTTDIKKAFYQPIIDMNNSALSEIDRVVEEVNTDFSTANQVMNTNIQKIENVINSNETFKSTIETKLSNFSNKIDINTAQINNVYSIVNSINTSANQIIDEYKKTEEIEVNLLLSRWIEDSSLAPFMYKIYLKYQGSTIKKLELLNDNPVLFSNFGFSLYKDSSTNKLYILSFKKPTTDTSIKILLTADSGYIWCPSNDDEQSI